jgi:hypothetical protein
MGADHISFFMTHQRIAFTWLQLIVILSKITIHEKALLTLLTDKFSQKKNYQFYAELIIRVIFPFY